MTTQLSQPFRANSVQPASADGGGAQLPLGKHPVIITEAEIKQVKDKEAAGLAEFTVEIIDGPSKGASGKFRLNIYSDSPKAVEIAWRQMSSLLMVCGLPEVQNLQQLYRIPFVIQVEPQTDAKYTQVTGFLDMSLRDPGKMSQNGPAPQSAQPAPFGGVASPPVQAQTNPTGGQWVAAGAPTAAPAASTPWGGGQPAAAPAPAAAGWGNGQAVQAPTPAAPSGWGAAPATGAPAGNAAPWAR